MKFYQKTTLMLSIVYATIIFGAEESTFSSAPVDICELKVPKDICETINGFTGSNIYYQETGHVKPYSCQLDWMTKYARQPFENRYLIQRNITPTSLIFTALSLSIIKFLSSMLPNKVVPFLYLLAPVIGFLANHIIANQLVNSHLTIKKENLELIKITADQKEIFIQNMLMSINVPKSEYRSLSNIKLKNIQSTPPLIRNRNLAYKNGPTYELEEDKVNIYLPYLPDSDDSDDDCQQGDKFLCSLSTPKKLIALDVSNNENIIVTLGEDGVHKFESQRRKNLYTIMNTDTD